MKKVPAATDTFPKVQSNPKKFQSTVGNFTETDRGLSFISGVPIYLRPPLTLSFYLQFISLPIEDGRIIATVD